MSIQAFYQSYKIVSNVPNDDLCQIGHITTIRIVDMKSFRKGMKIDTVLTKLLLSLHKTPCNIDTLEKVLAVAEDNRKLFNHWPKGKILFPGTVLSWGFSEVPSIILTTSGYFKPPSTVPINVRVNPDYFIAVF